MTSRAEIWGWAVIALYLGACYEIVDTTKLGDGPGADGRDSVGGTVAACSQWVPRIFPAMTATQYDGVDLLVAVDNSQSMDEEQLILSTGFFTLINALVNPLRTDPEWRWDAVENIRVAVVSSSLGLMYGARRETVRSPTGVFSCENVMGDDGNFLRTPVGTADIEINDGVLRCEADGGQCPDGWRCDNLDEKGIGVCLAPGGVTRVGCIPLNGTDAYAATAEDVENKALTTQVACMARQGTDGCGFEQQLEASLYGLQRHPEFMVDSHLLAVLIVSDEEDCSIEDPGLFDTAEWRSSTEQNIACNANASDPNPERSNERFLFPTARYFDGFTALKNGRSEAVLFGAIVGVPTAAESTAAGLPLCEGRGEEIAHCLDDANTPMEMVPMDFIEESNGVPYVHFRPACRRENPTQLGTYVTEARPGRRYVKVAEDFGENGFVYSICNPDWRPAMAAIAETIARRVNPSCFAEKLEWNPVPANRQPDYCADGKCGVTDCSLVVHIRRGIEESDACPDSLYASLTEAEKRAYLARKEVVPIAAPDTFEVTHKRIDCLVPKLPAPVRCDIARSAIEHASAGWYYCEEAGASLPEYKCRYNVEITDAGKAAVAGSAFSLYCLEESGLSDEACSSTTNSVVGTPCIQPGFSDGEYDSAGRGGVQAISFQSGCECMSYSEDLGTGDAYTGHFCTGTCSPAKQDCPDGYSCVDIFTDSYNRPDGLSRAYCVPDCFVSETCSRFDRRCVPSPVNGESWECRSI